MSNSDFQSLMEKILSDDGFAASLSTDPDAALQAAGVEATDDIIAAVKGVDAEALRKLFATFKGDHAVAS